jgi:hypothetical protein
VSDVSPLAGLTGLRRLNLRISGAANLETLDGLAAMEEFDAMSCPSGMPPFAAARGMKTAGLPRLTSDAQLAAFCRAHPGLETLRVSYCGMITTLAPAESLRSVRTLSADNCGSLSDVSAVAGMHALESVSLESCGLVGDIAPLLRLRRLREAALPPGLTDGHLDAFCRACPRIASLSLKRCRRITDLAPVGRLVSLTSLELKDCRGLTDLKPLHGLQRLVALDLRECPGIPAAEVDALLRDLPGCRVRQR